jgi:NADH-quinone oxidoreductase subunit L
MTGFIVAWVMYIRSPEWPAQIAAQHDLLYKFLLNKWYIDELYHFIFVRPVAWLARLFWKGGDGYVIDGFGPNGIAANVLRVTQRFVGLQTGFVYHYAFVMLVGVAGFVSWFMLAGGH